MKNGVVFVKYELNEYQTKLREQAIENIKKCIVPNIERIEFNGEILQSDVESLRNSGLWELILDDKEDWVTKLTVLIEIGKESPSIAGMFIDLLVSKSILADKYDQQFYSTAFVEEDAGSDLSRIQTEAKKVDDTWVINGEKWFVINPLFSAEFLVLARTSNQGYSILKVPQNAEGIIISEQEKMGLKGLGVSKVHFNNVSIPISYLLFSMDQQLDALQQAFIPAKLCVAALAIGISEAALQLSIERARSRHQFGNPIGDYQAIQFKIADITVGINAAKTLIYSAAQKLNRKEAAEIEAAMAKVYSSEVSNRAVNHAVQIYGTHGILEDSLVSRLYRSQRITEIFGQTSELQRIEIAKYVIENIGIKKEEVNYGF